MIEQYAHPVYVASGHTAEIRLTLEAMVDLLNALDDAGDTGSADVRSILDRHAFTRAAAAPAAAILRVELRMRALADRLTDLPSADVTATVAWINRALVDLHVTPSLTAHDGAGLHIHWTPANAPFDDQVVTDILMALAQELCDHGTSRFGRCAASDCDHVFYDATRNGSRRFCADPRCASRTHTADHRARQRAT
jgi:predicted RNA-binding Zn ribbon-like protein